MGVKLAERASAGARGSPCSHFTRAGQAAGGGRWVIRWWLSPETHCQDRAEIGSGCRDRSSRSEVGPRSGLAVEIDRRDLRSGRDRIELRYSWERSGTSSQLISMLTFARLDTVCTAAHVTSCDVSPLSSVSAQSCRVNAHGRVSAHGRVNAHVRPVCCDVDGETVLQAEHEAERTGHVLACGWRGQAGIARCFGVVLRACGGDGGRGGHIGAAARGVTTCQVTSALPCELAPLDHSRLR